MQRRLIFSLIFSFFIFSFAFSNTISITNQNYNKTQAQAILNQSISYINMINQSGYLIFNPNLSQAYAYLNRAQQTINSSPDASVSYSYAAESSANDSFQNIRNYAQYAFAVMFMIALFFGILLYFLMFTNKFSNKNKMKMKK